MGKPTVEDLRGAFRYTLKCARCGEDFVLTSPQAMRRKYCDDCRGIVKQEQSNDSRERNRRKRGTLIGETIEATCKICGKPFSYVYGGGMKRVFCDRCSARGSQVVYYGSDEPPRKKKKPRVSQIETINEAARASGMSYGQYQAMRYMKGV